MTDITDVVKNREIWCKALRSGDFLQTQEQLANYDYSAFCCLGVAEEVVGPLLPENITRSGHGSYAYPNPEYSEETEYYEYELIEEDSELHEPLRLALGLSREQMSILVVLNDSAHVDFDGIATVVENLNIHYDGKIYDRYGYRIITNEL